MSDTTLTATTGTLLRQAYKALVAQGEPMTTEELVPAVFATISVIPSQASWTVLLETLLQDTTIIIRQPDARWALAEWNAEGLSLDAVEFVVIDTETTGLSPLRHKLIEVAAVRVRGDETQDVFHELIQPRCKIPEFISTFTGITQETLRGAPKIDAVLPSLQQFIGHRPVVGHNIGFDLSFLSRAAEEHHWFFPTDGIDTIAMAMRFLPGIRRPKLDTLATRLGVQIRERHRALSDAKITAEVFRILLAKAREQGCITLADLYARLYSADETTHARGRFIAQSRPTGSMYLNPAWRKDFPERPGVYLMHDEVGTVIYVGKAKNLRARLASYYTHPLGYTRKMDGLLQNVRSIETRVLGSELEALLVESQLIKQLQPRYNVQLRNYEQYPFIKVDCAGHFPRVFATRNISADGARYFGPFNSRRAVDATIEIIQKVFPIRTCTRALPPLAKPSDPCLRYHMGRCPAPCRGNGKEPEYKAVIQEVMEFLSNARGDIVEALRDRMWQAAERDDFEKAAALRDAIQHVDSVLLGQQLIASAVEANNLLIIYPSIQEGSVEVFLIRHGRLIEQRQIICDIAAIDGMLDDLLRRAIWLGPTPTKIGKAEVDQINIIARWVHRYSTEFGRSFFTLPAHWDDQDLLADFRQHVTERILALAPGAETTNTEVNISETIPAEESGILY